MPSKPRSSALLPRVRSTPQSLSLHTLLSPFPVPRDPRLAFVHISRPFCHRTCHSLNANASPHNSHTHLQSSSPPVSLARLFHLHHPWSSPNLPSSASLRSSHPTPSPRSLPRLASAPALCLVYTSSLVASLLFLISDNFTILLS